MKKIDAKKIPVSIFKLAFPLLVLLLVQASINAQVPSNYELVPKKVNAVNLQVQGPCGTERMVFGRRRPQRMGLTVGLPPLAGIRCRMF